MYIPYVQKYYCVGSTLFSLATSKYEAVPNYRAQVEQLLPNLEQLRIDTSAHIIWDMLLPAQKAEMVHMHRQPRAIEVETHLSAYLLTH